LGVVRAVRYRRVVSTTDSLVLRRAGAITLVVGIVCTVVGTVMFGSKGLLAGVLGTVIAVGFFASGQYIVSRVLRNSPETAFMTALAVYVGQILVLFILLLVLKDATFFAPKVFAATIIACTLAWIFASASVTWRAKVLYVDPEGPK
jgi:ATP synthase protein I